jgi:hypothetical protein
MDWEYLLLTAPDADDEAHSEPAVPRGAIGVGVGIDLKA